MYVAKLDYGDTPSTFDTLMPATMLNQPSGVAYWVGGEEDQYVALRFKIDVEDDFWYYGWLLL